MATVSQIFEQLELIEREVQRLAPMMPGDLKPEVQRQLEHLIDHLDFILRTLSPD
jgi:hypothetical protein